jgi:hypothetical protein
MSLQTSALRVTRPPREDPFAVTHRGVIERLADPYLTDHDRWVLGQFARFLSGRAPGPDPRAVRLRSRLQPPSNSRVRRANL